MTLAVLCGGTGAALDSAAADQLADELSTALRDAGATRVVRPSGDAADVLRELARLAREARGRLLVCPGDLVVHAGLLRVLATEPGARSAALVAGAPDGALREERGRVAPGPGGLRFLGVLAVVPADLPALAAAAEAAAESAAAARTVPVTAPGGAAPREAAPREAAPRETAPRETAPRETAPRETAPRAAATPGSAPRVAGPGAAGPDGAAGPAGDPLDALLAGLLAAGVRPAAVRARLLHAERVRDAAGLAAARTARAAVDEDAALLRLAVKERDDFFTTYAVSSWSPLVTRWCARLRLTPAGVTGLSVLVAVAAAAAFWQASRPAMVAGAVLLYLGFVLDCVDGQLARYTRRFSPFGGWLDTMADRAKEFAVYAGLAAGAERAGLPYAWPLAIAALTVQTVRHTSDTWYGALHDLATTRPRPAAAGGGVGARLGAASERVQGDTGSPAYWAKRIVVFPIGERWALMAVLAAVADGRTALAATVAWQVLALGYTLALRGLRSAAMRVGVLGTVDTLRHRDDGPLVRALLARARLPLPLACAAVAVLAPAALVAALVTGVVSGAATGPALAAAGVLVLGAGLGAGARHDGPLDWLVPAALRAAEYLTVVAAGLAGAVPPPVVYVLLFLLALWHYDLMTRMQKGAPASGASASPGWDGRVVLVVASALAGVATVGTAAVAAIVAVGFGTGVLADRRAAPAPAGRAPESGTR